MLHRYIFKDGLFSEAYSKAIRRKFLFKHIYFTVKNDVSFSLTGVNKAVSIELSQKNRQKAYTCSWNRSCCMFPQGRQPHPWDLSCQASPGFRVLQDFPDAPKCHAFRVCLLDQGCRSPPEVLDEII